MLERAVVERSADLGLLSLEQSFFARATETVARDLIGKWLIRESEDGLTAGVIVETEAYGGPLDLASHARAGKTRRTTPMFGEVGHAYVYLVYGMHECLNVVAYDNAQAVAGAVLLRALEPVAGVDLMRSRRGQDTGRDGRLCSGPARLCRAMAVGRSFDGHDLTAGEPLWLAEPPDARRPFEADSGPRIGVDYSGEWAARPWRFWIPGHPSVSRR
ncbi:MAG: DNA-3-methyladenine glycosylase [Candidatus Limnocylindrales bacterium]